MMKKNNTLPLLVVSIKNYLRSKIFVLSLIFITLLLILVINVFGSIYFLKPVLEEATINKVRVSQYFSLILFSTSLIALGISINVFTSQPLVREKTRGIIESLLVTPLSSREIWITKSLAVYIPSFIFALILTLLSFILINVFLFIPKIGFFMNPWLILSSIIGLPLIYFFLCFLVHLVGLIGNPISGNIIAQIFLPAYASLVINLGIRDILNVASWFFLLINIIIAIVIGIIVLILKRFLTKERIILSSRS